MEVGLTVNSVTEVSLLALMTVAAVIAYCRLSKLDVVRRESTAGASGMLLDHLLLFLCIPAFFLYAIFSIVPALEQRSYLSITTIFLQVRAADARRRSSTSVKLINYAIKINNFFKNYFFLNQGLKFKKVH